MIQPDLGRQNLRPRSGMAYHPSSPSKTFPTDFFARQATMAALAACHLARLQAVGSRHRRDRRVAAVLMRGTRMSRRAGSRSGDKAQITVLRRRKWAISGRNDIRRTTLRLRIRPLRWSDPTDLTARGTRCSKAGRRWTRSGGPRSGRTVRSRTRPRAARKTRARS